MDETSTQALTLTEIKPISLDQATDVAKQLGDFLKENNLTVKIAGKSYVPVEGWQFCGAVLGLSQIIESCEQIAPFEDTKEMKYKAVTKIVNQNGVVVSRGYAWCSSKESKKKSFEEFAIASMAQTRSIGKAYRNILSWIVKMAGYEATPAEELNAVSMEAELTTAKQEVLKALNDKGIVKGTDVMSYIRNVLDKSSIDTVDDAEKVIGSLDEK